MTSVATCCGTALYLAALVGTPAFCANSDAWLCDQAAAIAAQDSNTPLEVLQAISRVETGRQMKGETSPWPWAVNYNGKGYWFVSEADAYDFANSLLQQGEDNFDVGCFQVNQHWHGSKFSSLRQAFSPNTNAAVAADFLKSLFDSVGNWGGAVAAYHSKTEANGQEYLTKVEAMLQQLRGQSDQAYAPVQVAERVSQNSFPLLQQGATRHGASLVPMVDAGTPFIQMAP
jgi:hypothetical protein